MSELQAALEFQVELSKFYNVDLFQRGYYQLRTSLKTSPKAPVKVEVSLPQNNECSLIFPASIINGSAVSKTFQILYRNEDVSVDDVILFKVQMLVDSHKIEESFELADFQLAVDLWFTEEEVGPEYQDKLQCVSQRLLKLHLDPNQGLHHHLPVLFDYFHLCVMCVTIHASLTSLHQPYLSFPGRPPRNAWQKDQNSLESLYFGSPSRPSTVSSTSVDKRFRESTQVHKTICQVLLSAYESLQTSFQSITERLPPYCQKFNLEVIDCHKKLDLLIETIQNFEDEEDFLQTAQSDVAQLCAENVILWSQYLEMVTLNDKVTHQLAKEHHLQRVKRFAEGFFTCEYSKPAAMSCYEPSVNGHSDVATVVRNSQYFQNIPPLDVACVEVDGDFNSTPIIFEDVYCDVEPAKQFLSVTDVSLDETPVTLRDRSRDSRSDHSSNFSDDSSPKFKRSSKFNLIKNIKLETIKRPSAQAMPPNSANVAGMGPTGATLVGYKKVDHDTSAPIVELGTLSPCQPLTNKRFTIAASMPSLGGTNSALHNLSGSMPDLCRSASLRNKTTLFTTSIEEGSTSKTGEDNSGSGSQASLNDAVQNGYLSSHSSKQNSPVARQRTDGDAHSVSDVNIEAADTAAGQTDGQTDASTQHTDSRPEGGDSGVVSVTDGSTLTVSEGTGDSQTYLTGECTLMELLNEEYEKSQDLKNAVESTISSTPKKTSSKDERGTRLGIGAKRLLAAKNKEVLHPSSSSPELYQLERTKFLVSPVPDKTINFIAAKENLRKLLRYQGHIYSDFPNQASVVPYFWPPDAQQDESEAEEGVHLVVCVHGLDGNSADLRLVRTYIEMALPGGRIDFLMSERNQPDTFADFDAMTTKLCDEILYHLDIYGLNPTRVSFIGHSLGNLIIRSALAQPSIAHLLPKLYTFLSLSGPHLGTLYNSSGLVNMGMWFMQKWKKSGSLLQLSLKDHNDPRQTFLYKLSQKPGLEFFRNIILISSQQDKYIPYHSSRIELCRAAVKDSTSLGGVYAEMVANILQPIIMKPDIKLIRHDVFHALQSTANNFIGRAAHIAVLDSEIFIEKFVTVCCLKYFK